MRSSGVSPMTPGEGAHNQSSSISKSGQYGSRRVPHQSLQADGDSVIEVDTIPLCGTDRRIFRSEALYLSIEAQMAMNSLGPDRRLEAATTMQVGDRELVYFVIACRISLAEEPSAPSALQCQLLWQVPRIRWNTQSASSCLDMCQSVV